MALKQDCLSPLDLEKQEHLSLDQLKKLAPKHTEPDNRPPANFKDLMDWVESSFKNELSTKGPVNKFVHNRVLIDGQFLKFCEEEDIEVSCLISDSTVSWKTDNNFEKYFAQGVFLIKGKGFDFLHAALFHKGNQNEDEISFFVIVPTVQYEKYLSLRNKFDGWVTQRDRSNLNIRVVDGEDIPYQKILKMIFAH